MTRHPRSSVIALVLLTATVGGCPSTHPSAFPEPEGPPLAQAEASLRAAMTVAGFTRGIELPQLEVRAAEPLLDSAAIAYVITPTGGHYGNFQVVAIGSEFFSAGGFPAPELMQISRALPRAQSEESQSQMARFFSRVLASDSIAWISIMDPANDHELSEHAGCTEVEESASEPKGQLVDEGTLWLTHTCEVAVGRSRITSSVFVFDEHGWLKGWWRVAALVPDD